jgi:hypothetical protein
VGDKRKSGKDETFKILERECVSDLFPELKQNKMLKGITKIKEIHTIKQRFI